MERTSALSTVEIVGIAAASAAALGSIVVALGRSLSNGVVDSAPTLESAAKASLTSDSVERGRDLAKSAVATLIAAYPELRDSANEILHRFSESARPQAARVMESASTKGEQVKQTGATVLDRFQEEVLPAASAAISSLVDHVGEAREQSTHARGDVRSAAANVKAVATQKVDTALTTSTNAAKDTAATLAWLGIASAVVYFVLLSPERREQLKSFLWSVLDEVTTLIDDFNGTDEEF